MCPTGSHLTCRGGALSPGHGQSASWDITFSSMWICEGRHPKVFLCDYGIPCIWFLIAPLRQALPYSSISSVSSTSGNSPSCRPSTRSLKASIFVFISRVAALWVVFASRIAAIILSCSAFSAGKHISRASKSANCVLLLLEWPVVMIGHFIEFLASMNVFPMTLRLAYIPKSTFAIHDKSRWSR